MIANVVRALVLTLIVVAAGTGQAQTKDHVRWERDFDKALKEAKLRGKPLMIDFYSDRVYWDLWLDAYTYTDKRVIELSTQFIPVRLLDSKRDNEISTRYNITRAPRVLFVDSNGKPLAEGYDAPGDFAKLMRQVLATKDLPTWEAELTKNPYNARAFVRLGVFWALAAATDSPRPRAPLQAMKYAAQAPQVVAKNPHYDFSELYLALGDMYQAREQYPQAIKYFEKVIQAGKPTSRVVYALVSEGSCQIGFDSADRMRAAAYADRAAKLKHLSKDDLQLIHMFKGQALRATPDKVTLANGQPYP